MFDFGLDYLTFDGALSFLNEYKYISSFFLALLVDEFVYLFLILYGSGNLPIYHFFIAIFAILSYQNIIYFTVNKLKNKHNILDQLLKYWFFRKIHKVFLKYHVKNKDYSFIILIVIQLLPFSRILIIFYALEYNFSMLRFFLLDLLIVTTWASIIFVPGYLIGLGYLSIEVGKSILTFVSIVVIFIVLLSMFNNKIIKFVERFKN